MITASDVETFERQGFLVVENLLDGDTLAAIRSEYSTLLDRLYDSWHAAGQVPPPTPGMSFWDKLDVAHKGGFDWYQPFDISLPADGITHDTPMHFGPAVFDMVTHPRILDLVEGLIGPEISSNPIQHVRIKPPEREVDGDEIRAHVVKTDWHQDQGVTLAEADDTTFVTVWLAITDATVENGCLQVATDPYDELLPHCAWKQTGIARDYVPQQATPTPVKAGGAVLFHPMTPHCSLTNTSDTYRWSFDLRYHVTGQPSGRSHFPEFVARSRANPQTELKDWRQWQSLWQDCRTQAATGSHIDQHGRWDTTAPYCA